MSVKVIGFKLPQSAVEQYTSTSKAQIVLDDMGFITYQEESTCYAFNNPKRPREYEEIITDCDRSFNFRQVCSIGAVLTEYPGNLFLPTLEISFVNTSTIRVPYDTMAEAKKKAASVKTWFIKMHKNYS